MKIKNYKQFKLESILEALTKDSKLQLTAGLTQILGRIEHTISETIFKRVSDDEVKNVLPDIVDVSPVPGMIKYRNGDIKIGRFINNVFPQEFTQQDIETFTNNYKALQGVGDETIIVVKGSDIPKWYDEVNYVENEGTLSDSCMRKKDASFFNIYAENPDIVSLVCLIRGGKLLGRALLWEGVEVEGGGRIKFMDRQYGSDATIQKLRNWAKENEYAFRDPNSTLSRTVNIGDQKKNLNMIVKLDKFNFEYYPYLDTFRRLDPVEGILYNDTQTDLDGFFILTRTDGLYNPTGKKMEESPTVWSNYYGVEIDRGEAVYSVYLRDWIYDAYCVEVTIGSRNGFYPDDYDELVEDSQSGEMMHRDDAVFSEESNGYILGEDAVSIVTLIESNGDCNDFEWFVHRLDVKKYVKYSKLADLGWFEAFLESYPNWNKHGGVSKKLLTKDPVSDELLPKDYVVKVFDTDDGMNMLTKFDAEILGIKLSKSSMTMDKLSYDKLLLGDGMLDKIIKKIGKSKDENLVQRLSELMDIKVGKLPNYE